MDTTPSFENVFQTIDVLRARIEGLEQDRRQLQADVRGHKEILDNIIKAIKSTRGEEAARKALPLQL